MAGSGGAGSHRLGGAEKKPEGRALTTRKAGPLGADTGEDQSTLDHIPLLTHVQDQLARFADCVFDPTDLIEIRRLPSGRSTWHVATELPELFGQLKADNAKGQSVYVGINPRKERGGRTTADVVLARCLFSDFDNVGLDGARERWQAAELPKPTLTVNSGHGVHAYWRLEETLDTETWTRFQRDLAAVLKSDPSVHDPPRLARLPGFVNHKEPVADCTIIDADPSRIYELAELHEHIPERPAPAPTVSNGTAIMGPRGLDVLVRAALYANKWEGLAERGRNSSAVRHAAQLTRDFGLSDAEAWPLLAAWNTRNRPPLDEAELRRCLVNGRAYGKNDVGCKADVPPPQQNSTKALPTDSLPADPGPSWYTIREIGESPTYYQGVPPITTGYASLDNALRGGFRPESAYIIAARTGSAKTTLALNIVRLTALSGHSVLLHKLEESPTEATRRMHAAASQVNLAVLLDGGRALKAYSNELADGWQLLRDLPIRISDRRELDAIGRISRDHVAEEGKLIVIDQLSMVQTPECGSQYERVSLISNTLRLLARDLHVPILIVSQVNRGAAKKTSKETLATTDLRDSGQLENDAAAVILIDRARKPDGPNWHTDPLTLEIVIGKNRYGPTTDPQCPLELWWWPWYCRIEERTPVIAEGAA
ncbi:MAG: DnaB-like helicase C-terminal domain-containing protein [Pseudomonadales bacterium]